MPPFMTCHSLKRKPSLGAAVRVISVFLTAASADADAVPFSSAVTVMLCVMGSVSGVAVNIGSLKIA